MGRPHGVRGEVTVVVETDDPLRFAAGAALSTESGRPLEVASARPFRDRGLLVAFVGVTDRTAAEALRGAVLLAAAATRRDLDDGEFWPEDLVGLRAVTPEGELLGMVSAVDFGEAQDRLVVRTPTGADVLVPFVDAIVGEPEGDRIVIDAPDGLF